MSKLTKKKKSFSNLTPTPAIGMIPTSPGSVPLAPSGYMNTPNNGVSIPEYQKQQLSRREAEHLMQSDRFTPVVMLPEELFNPHMGSYNSIYAASTYQFAQNNPDPLINSRGYEIFQEMLTMAACRGPFNQKRYDVLSLPGKTIPCITDPDDPNYEQAQEYAEFCDWCIKNIKDKADNNQDFRLVLFEVLMACWEGFHVTDIIYRILPHGPYKGKVGYSYFASKPAKEIGWQLDYETLAPMNIMPYTPLTGYESPKAIESSLIYTYDPQEGLPYGSGDGRACWKHYFILNHLLQLWSVASERWGTPILIVQYPAGQPGALQAAQTSIDNIKQGSAPVLPDNVKYELVKIDGTTLDGFKRKADWHTEQIKLNILGNTLTTGEGERTGSMAMAQVHQDTQTKPIEFVRTDLEMLVHLQLFRRLIRYNFGEENEWLAPHYQLSPPTTMNGQDALGNAQAINLLVGMGNMSAKSPDIRKIMGYPPMQKGEEDDIDEETQQRAQLQLDIKTGQQATSGVQRQDGNQSQAVAGKKQARRTGSANTTSK